MIALALHIGSAVLFLGIAAYALALIVQHCIIATRSPIGRLLRRKWRAR